MNSILFALWFFLPAGIANVTPIIASKIPYLSRWDTPIDGGATLRSRRLFGAHKTWRGFITGILAATIVVYIQQVISQNHQIHFLADRPTDYLFYSPFTLGFLFGFGALIGDAIESFVKRQCGIASGDTWFPFDQVDYILGGCLLTALVAPLGFTEYATIFATWFIMHMLFSYLGWLVHLKPKPI